MTPEQIEELGPAFAEYLRQFLYCCDYTQTFDLLNVYCTGLLSDLDRKSCEPIALSAGVAVRALQEFLRDHRWSFARVRDLLQRHVAALLPGLPDDELGTVGLHDETATAKDGRCTPGVQRQYCGELGKVENCIVTVHTAVAKGRFKTLFDAELFLPESWGGDRGRCRRAAVPDGVTYRPKWQIALGQLDRALANGARFDWFTFDEGYGDKPGYLHGLELRQVRYAGEVPKSFRCCGARPRRGRADDLVRHSPLFHRQGWHLFVLPRQTAGEQQWEVKAARVWLTGPAVRAGWLIWARGVRSGEEKYFVSNAAADEPVERIVRAAFCRWNVEHAIRLSKGEVGLRHYEGRSYVGLMRHLTLCCVTLTFVAGRAAGLRGEKPGGDRRAGQPRAEPGVRGGPGAVARHDPVTAHVGGHLLPPAA
jgi:SRSO17 transposase